MKNNKTLLIVLLAVVVLGVLSAVLFQSKRPEVSDPAVQTATTEEAAPVSAAVEDSAVNYDSASLPTSPLGVRTLGNPDAPVKIEEFASLTCGHCAAFHNSTFPQLKTKYIDTGKVFFTFTDFPLNAPALDGTMVTRCMPPERYFTFLSFLFQTQEQWAFSQDYKNSLRQNAKLAGMTDERFDSCLADTGLKDGIVNRMQEKAKAHTLNSTPSFVINGTTVITGAVGIEVFDKAIAEAESGMVAAPVTATPENAATPEAAPEAVEAAPEAVEEETAPEAVEPVAETPATTAPETTTEATEDATETEATTEQE